MTHLQLVIFDCDGVLVDSELIASRELAAYLTDLGRPTTDVECRNAFTGISIQSVGDKVRSDWGLDLPQDFVAQLRARDQLAFERHLHAIDGAAHILDTLDATNVRYCVASSGTPEKIRHSLTITKLIERFDANLFSASQVAHGKPAPDLFLFAAQTMGVSPSKCVVIEDSPAGVMAAKRAGMRVIGFTGGSHCDVGYADKLHDADVVAATMDSVSRALDL